MVTQSRFKLQSLFDFGGRYIYCDSRVKTEYNRICSKQMDITMRRFLIKMMAILISYFFAMVGPLQAYFVHGIKTTTLEARIPFCQQKSDAEFMGNVVIQTAIAGHGLLVYIGLEIFLSLFENVVSIVPQLIESELITTVQLYEDKSISDVELYWRIKNIVMLSQDADK